MVEPKTPRILVIGECFTDRYLIGTSTRLSPEAPVPVVIGKEVIQNLGGAGNVTANLRSLGAEVTHIYQSSPPPIKIRIIANGQQLVRWDENDTADPFGEISSDQFDNINGVIFSDYSKGAFTPHNISTLISYIPEHVPLFVDTKASPLKFRGHKTTFFFPNMKEWLTHRDDYDKEYNVIRTESENGMTYLARGGRGAHQPALATKVVCVSGAGDSVISGFSYYYCLGHTVAESLEFTSKVAAISISKPYTSTVTHEEIIHTFG